MPSRPGPRSNPSFFAPQPDPLAAADDEGAFEYNTTKTTPQIATTTTATPGDGKVTTRDTGPDGLRPNHHPHTPADLPRPPCRDGPTITRPRGARDPTDRLPPPAYSDSESDGTVAPKNEKGDKWAGIKSKGRRGLSKLGRVASTYAAAQMAGGGGKSNDRERSLSRDTYDDRRSGRGRGGRSRYSPSPSPSPSPPRRRGTARHSRRDRPPMNGRQKSYSVSPAPLSRDPYDRDGGRGRGGGRSNRRRARSPSYSDSSRSSSIDSRATRRRGGHRRGRSEGDYDDRRSRGGGKDKKGTKDGYRDNMRAPKPEVADRWQMAARAALEAGGVTAFRLRKEPGTWGEKLPKIATAAMGAAAIDAFIDKDPRRQRSGGGGGVKGMAQSVIGGMIASKVMGFKSATTHRGKPRYK
ncbi:hypothetical protein PG989_003718 [Apiospora arundinis]